jgi:hypothetical protein
MQLHQDTFKIQPETRRHGDKIDVHNTHIHDHSLSSGLVQTFQYNVTVLKLVFCTQTTALVE